MPALLLFGGLALLWVAVTGRADALVLAIVNPAAARRGGSTDGTPTPGPNPLDPGGTELQPPYSNGGIPQYPSPPLEEPGMPPGWYGAVDPPWYRAL